MKKNKLKQKLLVITDYIGESPNSTPYVRLKVLKDEFDIDLCLRKKNQYINNDLDIDVYPYGFKSLIKVSKENRYSFIYVQGIHNYFYAYKAAKSINAKLVIDIFDHISLGKSLLKTQKSVIGRMKYIFYHIYFYLGKYTIKKADLVFLTLNKGILKYYPVRKEGYIHLTNGIWKDIVLNNKKKKEINKKFRFIYVGYVREDRGIYKILEAIRRLKEDKFNFEVDIVGPISDIDSEKINKYIDKYKINSQVTIHGFLDYNKVKMLLSLSNVALYFFPIDKIELKFIYPIKIFEYLAFDLPIIATEGEGIKELSTCYNEHIMLCKYDSESLYKNMKKSISNLSYTNGIIIKEEHLWENINEKFIKCIRGLEK